MRAANAFLMMNMLKCMYRMQPIRTIFWGIPNLILSISNYMNNKGFGRVITKIELLECGRKVNIFLKEGRALKNVDIQNLSTIEPSDLHEWTEDNSPAIV